MGDASASSGAVTSKPGLMICTPSLKQPGPENYEMFLRWTKLHFRDLVDIEPIPGGKITRAIQFVTPGAIGGIGEYFNVIQASHYPIWLSEGYKANSKRLDLENTRSLYKGEDPVGCKEGTMVFEICNALFSIYEPVYSDDAGSYHEHPRIGEGEKKVLVAVNFDGNGEVPKDSLAEVVKEVEGMGMGKVYASLYELKEEAQPFMHATMEKTDVGGGKYLGLVAIMSKEGALKVGEVRQLVDLKAGKKEGVKVGVWEEEVYVGEREEMGE